MRYLLLAVLLIALAGSAMAATISVPADQPTIQAAIAAASNGDTIQVAAGTFTEAGQIDIAKNLTIIGAGSSSTIVKPDSNTDSSSNKTGAWIYVNAGNTVTLAYLGLDGGGKQIHHAVQSRGNLTVEECDIRNIGYTKYLGRGIVLFAGTSNLVKRCTFSNIERIGVHVRGSVEPTNPVATITGCTYVGKGAGDWLDYAFEMGGGGQATVANCAVSDCTGVAASDGSTSAGILATDYYGTGTTATVKGCTITDCTDGIAVGYASTDGTVVTANYNDLSNNASGINQVGAQVVSAENNWWGAKDGPGAIALGSGVQVTTNVDYTPWLTTPYVNLAFGGGRLEQKQHTDGAWGWPLNAPPTYGNIHGPIAMGLAKAYRASGDAAMLSALQDAATYLQSKTLFSVTDGYLAAELDTILGGTANVAYVKANFFDKLVNGTYLRSGVYYNTQQYVNLIRTSRASQGIPNLGAWDIGMGIVGANACGADITEWVAGTKAEVNELSTGYYDVIGLAGALYGLAYAHVDFDPTSGLFAGASNLDDLAAALAGYQLPSGGFTWETDQMDPAAFNEADQETAYAILALNAVGGYKTNVLDAVGYLKSSQIATGGWGGSGENNEVTGEAMWALSSENLLSLDAPAASLYVKPSEPVVVKMNVSNLTQLVKGCQAMLGYSSTYLTAAAGCVVPGGGAWDELIYNSWDVGSGLSGEIDTAIGVYGESTTGAGTDADGTVAVLTLTPTGTQGITQIVFRPDADPDPGLVESTMLSDMSGNPLWPNKWDSQVIVIDGALPVIDITSAEQGTTELLGPSAPNAVQGTVNITVTASDALAGLAGTPVVTVTQGASSLPVSFVNESPMGTFNYTVAIGSSTPNGTWTIAATATDKAGNAATDTDTFNVNKNQITGLVELQQYIGTSRPVTMVATGGASTKTWTIVATGTVTAYTLTDVPAGTTGLSAKTAWSLRNKLASVLDGDGQAIGVDFTGDEKLLGGDINGSNSINVLDYSLLKLKWLKSVSVDPSAAAVDIDGSGTVNVDDYNIMKLNWFKLGDAQ